MILKTKNTKQNLTKLDLITISFVLAYFGALLYPHKALAGGALLDGKIIIEVLLFSSFVLFATSRLAGNEPVLEKSILSAPIASLTALILFSSFFAQNRPIALEAIFLYLSYISCFFIFLYLLKDNNQKVSLVYIIISITLFLCLRGLVQYHFINLNPRITTVWRLRSTFGNSNQMAGFLSMTIPLYVGLMFTKERSTKTLFTGGLVLLIMIASLLFTYARSGWIATTCGIIFILAIQFFFQNLKLKKIIPPLLSVFLILAFFFVSSTNLVSRFNTMTQEDTDNTLYGRQLAWKGTVNMIKSNLLTGVGPGNYSKAFRSFQPPGLSEPYKYAHNDYLHFISETGVLLIPILFWLFYSLFKYGLEKIRTTGSRIRGITLGAMGGIIAILVYSMSDFNLHIPANALLFTILTAIVTAPVFEEKNIVY